MSLRVSIVGVVWLFVLILVVFSPINQDQHLIFDVVPIRSIVHFFLFWGLVHMWICALKKQLKFGKLKKNAFLLVGVIVLNLAIFSEVINYASHLNGSISFWNFIFDISGILIGMITFRLLYSSCY